ncbi:response regulator [Azospirillum sp. TSO22-1]|uniref:response regulator n=1 Tax=Azospirillum sp. TSO22-1 TaxID=716789 RepID=UPI000D6032DB|nr:response regulator [Azospirillum sp. TSO22-1]PWC41909.1 chemotaxis protein CheY [Azospirillum sp. TSO22-1]
MSEEAHILVVDDEAEIREMFAEYLRRHGFRVSEAGSGEIMRRVIDSVPVDLVLLDLRMPGEDGLSLARALRASTDAGIIMVTAVDEAVDRVIGLEMGADDYIGKPCDLRELLARIKSVLRRRRAARPAATVPAGPGKGTADGGRVRFGTFVLDLGMRRLLRRDGTVVPLTAMEFDLLHAFATHPNRVLTRDQLLDLAHKRGPEPFDRSIDVRVTRIRRKIEVDPAKPQVIKTVRNGGYMFVSNPEA